MLETSIEKMKILISDVTGNEVLSLEGIDIFQDMTRSFEFSPQIPNSLYLFQVILSGHVLGIGKLIVE